MAIVIPIVTEYADRGMKSAIAEVKKAEGAFGKLGAATSLLGPALATAGIAAAGFGVAMAVDGVKGAAEEEKQIKSLTTTLANLGIKDATNDVLAFADSLARSTTFDDTAIRGAFQAIVTSAGDAQTAMDLTRLSLDAATGSGKSLEAVQTAMAKAAGGNTAALSRLFPFLDKTRLSSEGLDYATKALADRFSGQAAAAADTWEGRLGNVAKAFDELKESFGKGFLDGMANAGNGAGDLTDTLYELQGQVEDIGRTIGESLADILTLIGYIRELNKAFQDWRDTLKGTAWGAIFDGIATATNNLINPLKVVLGLIDAIKSGIQSLRGLSVPSIPGLSSAAVSPSRALAGTYSAPTVNVHVTAGIGDPIAIARQVENVLRTRNVRLGTT